MVQAFPENPAYLSGTNTLEMESQIKFKKIRGIEIFLIFLLSGMLGCSKNDPGTPPPVVIGNESPTLFDLLAVADNAESVEVTPSFSWNKSTDPEGGPIRYELYMDGGENPTTLIASGLESSNFNFNQRLRLQRGTDYTWKVVAGDSAGAKTESNARFSFSVRQLNLPDLPTRASAEFSGRYQHTLTEFNDEIWLIGGDGGGADTEIWKSSDGLAWELIVPTSPFAAKTAQATVIFDDKLWVLGGFDPNGSSEIWNTTDGTVWNKVLAATPYGHRFFHSATVFKDKIYVIGGSAGVSPFLLNDVWSSPDGVNWTKEPVDPSFPNAESNTAVVFKGKIWALFDAENGLWNSEDGTTWSAVETVNPVSIRGFNTTTVFDGKIYVIGGEGLEQLDDIWSSADGITWQRIYANSPFSQRQWHATIAFKEQLILIGGRNGANALNDIWVLD